MPAAESEIAQAQELCDANLAGADLTAAVHHFKNLLQHEPSYEQVDPLFVRLRNQLMAADRIVEILDDIDRYFCARLEAPVVNPGNWRELQEVATERGIPSFAFFPLPKSASNYTNSMLHRILGTATARLGIDAFPDDHVLPRLASRFSSGGVMGTGHIHGSEHNVSSLIRAGFRKLVIQIRDPRQTVLSAIYDIDYMISEGQQPTVQEGWNEWTLGEKIDDLMADRWIGFLGFISSWWEASHRMSEDLDILLCTYEDMRSDEEVHFSEIVRFLGLEPNDYSFDVEITKSREVRFRKGLIDEWRSVFSADQRELAWSQIPPELAEYFGWTP